MNDKDLADATVALGVGSKKNSLAYSFSGSMEYGTGYSTASEFVRNWHVAGALMEKCIGMTVESMEIDSGYGRGWEVYNAFSKETKFGGGDHSYKFTKANGESLPRAITEACVEALNGE